MEAYATTLANAPNTDDLIEEILSLVDKLGIDLEAPANVIYGRDTRPSGVKLVASLSDGLSCTFAKVRDHGVITTPVLHYLVRCINTKGTEESYGTDSEESYYIKLSAAFKELMVKSEPNAFGLTNGDCRQTRANRLPSWWTVQTAWER